MRVIDDISLRWERDEVARVRSPAVPTIVGRDAWMALVEALESDGDALAAFDRFLAATEPLRSVPRMAALRLSQEFAERQSMRGAGALGRVDLLVSPRGDEVAYRGAGEGAIFERLRLIDGSSLGVVRDPDENFESQLAWRDDGFALVSHSNLVLRPLSFGAPQVSSPALRRMTCFTSVVVAANGIVAARTDAGSVMFRDTCRGGGCDVPTAAPSRNATVALSGSGARYAAFDGDTLKIWNTTICAVIDVVGPVVATRMTLGSDERTLLYAPPLA